MQKNPLSLLILAAGIGSRFGSDKQIFKISALSLPLIDFALQDAQKNHIRHAVIVTRSTLTKIFQDDIIPRFPSIQFDLVFQDLSSPKLPNFRTKPWGTGHAALCGKPFIRGNFITMNADDFYGPHAIATATQFLQKNIKNQFYCVGYPLGNTLSPNGPVSRGIIHTDPQNLILDIEEMTHIRREINGNIVANNALGERCILSPQQAVSLNLFGLNSLAFDILEEKFQQFLAQNASSDSAEFYLPAALTAPDSINKLFAMELLPTYDHWLGLTYKNDLPHVELCLNQYIQQGRYR